MDAPDHRPGQMIDPSFEAMTEAERNLVRVVLTAFIAGHRGQRGLTHPILRIVNAISANPVAGTGPGGGWPTGKAALRVLKLDSLELDTQLAGLVARHEHLQDGELHAFFPPSTWPNLLEFVKRGPTSTWTATENYLRLRAQGGCPLSGRSSGPLSTSSLEVLVTAYHLFASTLDGVRQRRHDLRLGPSLDAVHDQWKPADFPARVSGVDLGAKPAERDRSAPPLRLVRYVLLGLNWEVENRCKTYEGRNALQRVLRYRALLGVAATFGLRRDVLETLTPAHLIPDHRFHDGSTGPAIRVFPGKTLHRGTERIKAMPPQLYQWTVEWITHAGLGENDRLFTTLDKTFTAILRAPGRNPGLNPYYRLAASSYPDPHYSAHTLRHLADQLACCAGNDWLHEHRDQIIIDGTGLPTRSDVFAAVLLDHEITSVSDVYKDVKTPKGRERWCRETVLRVWDYLVGERGAPRGLDNKKVETLAAEVRRAEEHNASLLAEITAIQDQMCSIEFANLHGDDLTRALLEQQQSNVRLGQLKRVESDASEAVAEAREAYEKARTTLVPLGDLDTDLDSVPDSIDDADEDEDELPVLREYAWPAEFCWAVGTNILAESTLRRWMSGRLPYTPNDRRRMFEPRDVEVISSRLRRLRLDTLDWTRLPVHVQERLEIIRRRPDPRANTP